MVTIIRQDSAFNTAKQQLDPQHLEARNEQWFALLWAVVLDFHAEHDKLPNADEITTEILARDAEDPDYLDEDDVDELNKFMGFAYAANIDAYRKQTAMGYLKRLLEEHLQQDIQAMTSGDQIDDLPDMLKEKTEQATRLKSLETGPIPEPFPETVEEIKPLDKTTTGVSFIDEYMGGGQAPGEVYCFCGPYGSCKTTLGVQLAVESCIREYEKCLEAGGDPEVDPIPLTYLVAWEEEQESLQHRALAYAGQVRRDSLEEGFKTLSRTSNLKGYEKKMFKAQLDAGSVVDGEYERVQSWIRLLNKTLRFVDFTGGYEKFREWSGQMVSGVEEAIRDDQDELNQPGVAMIAMDYAGAAAERYCDYNNKDPDNAKRHLIGGMPIRAKNRLALPFSCPVWLMHQLNTKANARAAGVAPKPTDCAEANNFFENANFGFMVGVPTLDHLCVLTNGKQRRARRQNDRVLFIDGALATVRDTRGRYIVDGGKITKREDRSRVVDDETTGDVADAGSLFGNSFGDDIGV